MKKIIPVNLYWLVIILCVISVVYLHKMNKAWKFYALSAIGVFAVQLVFGKTKAYNFSGKTIYKKDEETDSVIEIPSCYIATDLDGVGLPESKKVVKVQDSTSVICLPCGHYVYADLISGAINLIGGGTLTTPPDDGWKLLFEKTGVKPTTPEQEPEQEPQQEPCENEN